MEFAMPDPLCEAYQISGCYRYVVSNMRMLHMKVEVQFMDLMDDQEDFLMPEVLREERYEFWFDINQLSEDAAGERTVREMLMSVGVMYTPCHEFMVQTILFKVASVASDQGNRDAVVLPMSVWISCVDPRCYPELALTSDEADYMDEDESGDDDGDGDGDDIEEDAGPGLEGLTEGEVSEGSIDCAICCDDIPVGSTGSSMPCRHVYHRECIVKWLRKSRTCPLCRFQLPSSTV